MPTTWSKMPPDFPLVILWFSARHDLKVDSVCVCLGEGGGVLCWWVFSYICMHLLAYMTQQDVERQNIRMHFTCQSMHAHLQT